MSRTRSTSTSTHVPSCLALLSPALSNKQCQLALSPGNTLAASTPTTKITTRSKLPSKLSPSVRPVFRISDTPHTALLTKATPTAIKKARWMSDTPPSLRRKHTSPPMESLSEISHRNRPMSLLRPMNSPSSQWVGMVGLLMSYRLKTLLQGLRCHVLTVREHSRSLPTPSILASVRRCL